MTAVHIADVISVADGKMLRVLHHSERSLVGTGACTVLALPPTLLADGS